MDRKEFIKKSVITGISASLVPGMIKAKNVKPKKSTFDQMMKQVGFNHLPNQENKTMNTILHKADTRGRANHGWLDSHHSFSFANYYNPDRMNFGVLRVLNDDVVAQGRGFGTHPHDNMEIISIPLSGDLEHKDSMGNVTVIKEGDIQVMSAGTGVYHSEFNKNKDKEVRFLQIWLFPNQQNVEPRYDQISITDVEKKNEFYQILSPSKEDDGVWIHQNAWFHMGKLDSGKTASYSFKDKDNGVYAFVLEGDVSINGQELNRRDGYGMWNMDQFEVEAQSDAKVLLMEVPMKLG